MLYEGAAGHTFSVDALIGEATAQGSGAFLSFSGTGGSYGSVEVVYSYTAAVPEPGNVWAGLAALGFCGIQRAGWFRRPGACGRAGI